MKQSHFPCIVTQAYFQNIDCYIMKESLIKKIVLNILLLLFALYTFKTHNETNSNMHEYININLYMFINTNKWILR